MTTSNIDSSSDHTHNHDNEPSQRGTEEAAHTSHTSHEESPAGEGSESGSAEGHSRRQNMTPRIPVGDSLEIDVIREQLENFGRVVILRSTDVVVSDRSVNLLSRALRVTRVPRSHGPTHYAIPRHNDRAGALLPATKDWDAINWRTRGATAEGSHALLLSRLALKILPPSGPMTWAQIEEALATDGVNGVYEPLAVALVAQGPTILPRPELFGLPVESSTGKRASKLLNMAASVLRGSKKSQEKSTDTPTIELTEAGKTGWAEKLAALALTKPYVVASPFSKPEEGVHDWAIERCAEVLRHALEWRQVQTVILCDEASKGKAERLRIIAGGNTAVVVTSLPEEETVAAIAGARAVLATPGTFIQWAHQTSTPSVCLAGVVAPQAMDGAQNPSHILVRPGFPEGKVQCPWCLESSHSCNEDLEAGAVARALSRVLTLQTHPV